MLNFLDGQLKPWTTQEKPILSSMEDSIDQFTNIFREEKGVGSFNSWNNKRAINEVQG